MRDRDQWQADLVDCPGCGALIQPSETHCPRCHDQRNGDNPKRCQEQHETRLATAEEQAELEADYGVPVPSSVRVLLEDEQGRWVFIVPRTISPDASRSMTCESDRHDQRTGPSMR